MMLKRYKVFSLSILLALFAVLSPLKVQAATSHYPEIKSYESPLVLVTMSFNEESKGDIVLLYGGFFEQADFERSDAYKNDLDPLWTFYWAQVYTGKIKA